MANPIIMNDNIAKRKKALALSIIVLVLIVFLIATILPGIRGVSLIFIVAIFLFGLVSWYFDTLDQTDTTNKWVKALKPLIPSLIVAFLPIGMLCRNPFIILVGAPPLLIIFFVLRYFNVYTRNDVIYYIYFLIISIPVMFFAIGWATFVVARILS